MGKTNEHIDSTCGLTCATKYPDVEQDHDLGGGGCGAGRSAGEHLRALVHSGQRIEPESLSARLLREQSLLRDIEEEHYSDFPTARKECFGI
jgi:hypothetical protein